jgi:hypothetical protein
MSDAAFEALYRRLGPVLYARAARVVSDDVAKKLVEEVVTQVSKLKGLSDAELLTRARALMNDQVQQQGSGTLDSLLPGISPSVKKP